MPPNKPPSKPQKLGAAVGQSGLNVGASGSPNYDRTNFYMASIDSNKNSQRVRIGVEKTATSMRVPPFVVARAVEWVEDPRTPYRAFHDMVRDSLVHRTYQLEDIAQTNPSTSSWQLARIHAEIVEHSSFAARAMSAIDDLKAILSEAWLARDMKLWERQMQNGRTLVGILPTPYNDILQAYLDSQKSLAHLPTSEAT